MSSTAPPSEHAERLATQLLGAALVTATGGAGRGVPARARPGRGWRRRCRPTTAGSSRRGEPGRWDHERELQRTLWDGGFAGICFPAEYGGLGLTPAHQRAFTEESLAYDMPYSLNVPTLGILAATLVDHGTDEQKARHLPAILKGEEIWVQFLSEPSGGSDLAGCLTRADRDGDVFILNGSKIWSSGAVDADYAMCLARTNWDVPKHRGLTMFIMAIHQPGVQVEQIRQVDGSLEFCQEFFDDVPIPVTDVVGEVDDGWTVAGRLLVHERLRRRRRVAVHERPLGGSRRADRGQRPRRGREGARVEPVTHEPVTSWPRRTCATRCTATSTPGSPRPWPPARCRPRPGRS